MKKLWKYVKGLHWSIKAVVGIFTFYIILTAWGIAPGIIPSQDNSNQGHSLEYVVTGSIKKASVTYTNEKGWTYQKDIDVPWRWTAPSNAQDGTSFYISAESNEAEGWVEAEIIQDGKVFKRTKQFGPYVTATAMGYAGDK